VIKISYEEEFSDDEPIRMIANREFKDNEFKAAIKQGQFMFAGHTKKKDLKEHMRKAKEIFE